VAVNSPLVSVITPVYNGAAYLEECIHSVLAQSYDNFEYIIADNCSTDDSLEIAQKAAVHDSRITVIQCDEHVGPIQNWNRSLQSISRKSDFIKFVHADDWMFPDCVSRMVDLAEMNGDVGLISAYRLEEDRVSLDRLPVAAPLEPGRDTFTMSGRDVARAILREKASVLGSPTNFLLRSNLLLPDEPFFCEDFLHSDKEACLRIFAECDFGFVRQVLTFTRRHNESVTSKTNSLDTRRQDNLLMLCKHGPEFLSESEYSSTLSRELRSYYDFLAKNVGVGMGNEFWDSHRQVLEAGGSPFRVSTLLKATLRRWANPIRALKEHRKKRSRQHRKPDRATMQLISDTRTDREDSQV
jgi:glycosyltransferase involved in cell wall biosynthesis